MEEKLRTRLTFGYRFGGETTKVMIELASVHISTERIGKPEESSTAF